jgi:hypothetical protein
MMRNDEKSSLDYPCGSSLLFRDREKTLHDKPRARMKTAARRDAQDPSQDHNARGREVEGEQSFERRSKGQRPKVGGTKVGVQTTQVYQTQKCTVFRANLVYAM